MRARMALRSSGIAVEIREIALKNKPQHMLQISPKGTVPVLVLQHGEVLDESLDIMRWALAQHDPDDWLMAGETALVQEAERLIVENDGSFKRALDRYKYAVRFPEQPSEVYRAEGEVFLQQLEARLSRSKHLCRDERALADIAVFPFVRQFSLVDEAWFAQAPYPALRNWLKRLVESELFLSVMEKQEPWVERV